MVNLHFKYLKPTTSEDVLVLGLKGHDQNSFSYLYDHYAPGMFSCINKIVNDNEQAEDLLHDAFIRIWKNISKYDPDKGRLYTWVINVCRNIAIDAIRKTKRTRIRDQKIEIEQEDMINPQTVSVNKMDAAIINKKVMELKKEQRLVIDMAYNHGYSHYEIASKLEMPVGTVKSRIYQGIRIIKLAMSA